MKPYLHALYQESVQHWRCCCQCQLSTWQFKNLIANPHTTLPNDNESMSNKTLSLSLVVSFSLSACAFLCFALPHHHHHRLTSLFLSLSLSLSLLHTSTQNKHLWKTFKHTDPKTQKPFKPSPI